MKSIVDLVYGVVHLLVCTLVAFVFSGYKIRWCGRGSISSLIVLILSFLVNLSGMCMIGNTPLVYIIEYLY